VKFVGWYAYKRDTNIYQKQRVQHLRDALIFAVLYLKYVHHNSRRLL